jgi:hypothetical protein
MRTRDKSGARYGIHPGILWRTSGSTSIDNLRTSLEERRGNCYGDTEIQGYFGYTNVPRDNKASNHVTSALLVIPFHNTQYSPILHVWPFTIKWITLVGTLAIKCCTNKCFLRTLLTLAVSPTLVGTLAIKRCTDKGFLRRLLTLPVSPTLVGTLAIMCCTDKGFLRRLLTLPVSSTLVGTIAIKHYTDKGFLRKLLMLPVSSTLVDTLTINCRKSCFDHFEIKMDHLSQLPN